MTIILRLCFYCLLAYGLFTANTTELIFSGVVFLVTREVQKIT